MNSDLVKTLPEMCACGRPLTYSGDRPKKGEVVVCVRCVALALCKMAVVRWGDVRGTGHPESALCRVESIYHRVWQEYISMLNWDRFMKARDIAKLSGLSTPEVASTMEYMGIKKGPGGYYYPNTGKVQNETSANAIGA